MRGLQEEHEGQKLANRSLATQDHRRAMRSQPGREAARAGDPRPARDSFGVLLQELLRGRGEEGAGLHSGTPRPT